MKPNFALNLSHDGIVLLHRASSGWHQMGEVALDAPDMAAELAELRQLATSVSTSGLATKLVIPNSQILYRSLPDPGEATRDAAIRAALDGATPYALDDLVWASTVVDGQVQVAVIARETLEEAESFATEHRFNPISFVALPDANTYTGEPFFGRAKSADALIGAGTKVEPDETAIQILPTRKLPPPPVDPVISEAVEAPSETIQEDPADLRDETQSEDPVLVLGRDEDRSAVDDPEAETEADAAEAPAEDLEDTSASKVDTPEALDDAAEAETDADNSGEDSDEAPFEDVPYDEDTGAEEAKVEPPQPVPPLSDIPLSDDTESDDVEITDVEETPTASAFHSRRLTAASPTTSETPAETTATPRLSARPARFSALPESGTPAHKPLGPATQEERTEDAPDISTPEINAPAASRPQQEHPHVAVTSGDLPVEDPEETTKPKAPRPGKSAPLPEPPPMPASPRAPEPRPVGSSDKKAPKAAAKEAAKGALKSLSGLSSAAKSRMDKAKDDRAKKGEAQKEAAKTETLALRTQSATTTGIATEIAPMSDRAAGLDRAENTIDEAEALTVFGARRSSRTSRKSPRLGLILTGVLVLLLLIVGLIAGFLPDDEAATDAPAQQTSALEQNSDVTVDDATAVLSPDEAMAPETVIAEASASDDVTEDAALEDEPELTPELLEQAALPEPPGAQNEMPEPDLEALNAQYAATGIWPLAPENGTGETGEDDLNAVYTASIDPRISSQDAGALSDPTRNAAETAPRAALQPAPPGTRYDYDEDGFIRATPEGTVTPEGAVVYAGRPDIITKPRPGSAVDESVEAALDPAPVDENDPVRLALAAFQPKLRPESLVENTEKANLGGMTRAELGGFAPKLRPASAQELAEEDARTETPDEQPRTAPVVTVSLVPKARPQDLEKLAAAARAAEAAAAAAAEAGTTQTSAAAQVTARVPASPLPQSDPANVARAATVKNAINLRRLNLMGVYGSSSDRRALVRLPSGRFAKVKIGDRLDGGRVQSIGSDNLTYVKNGRAVTLEIQG
ncbi:hypothetical protein [Celeribacter sp. PS-C1]|uniref:hypothetical protein n=1 Tax=Celeribacter sp. PS-C1 TaxID=2820813 RepID=UPI001CA5DEDB|nr:hypothetical protein [Celeribacter sp. PS-C1]MBW6416777.1 hypothetical protein [Celeribacter sp. PS-C1]